MNDKTYAITFHGRGADFLLLYLKNICLTVLTLGLYRFWARAAMTQKIYRHAEFDGERFDFHGTGREMFNGFCKAVGLFIMAILLLGMLHTLMAASLGDAFASGSIGILIYAAIIMLQPLVMIGSRRFALSRTSWRQVRFGFDGRYKEMFWLLLRGLTLNIVTFGLYMPWFLCDLKRYFVDRTRFGQVRFSYTGEGGSFMKVYFLGLILTFVTFGLYSFAWRANMERYDWEHTHFARGGFRSDITGWSLFCNSLSTFLLVACTLGLGFPWALCNSLRFYLARITYTGDAELERVVNNMDNGASGLADGLQDAGDMFGNLAAGV